MGFTPVNHMEIDRDFETREIILKWRDDVLGPKEKRFKFEEKVEAMAFATRTFNALCM
jgi:hypothetical protein